MLCTYTIYLSNLQYFYINLYPRLITKITRHSIYLKTKYKLKMITIFTFTFDINEQLVITFLI